MATLDAAQVERYGTLIDAILEAAAEAGHPGAVACEILSTQPYPLRRVIAGHGLGRFRITQKADLGRADDVYRSENARPEDWVMLGNHDTRSILPIAEEWVASGAARAQAEYLATRLLPPEEPRAPFTARVAGDAWELVQARAAELFVGPARQVMIFFTDLLGERGRYNAPGTVSADNWSLRGASGPAPRMRAASPRGAPSTSLVRSPEALRGPGVPPSWTTGRRACP